MEEIFGWMKTVGGFRRTRYRGLDRTGLAGFVVGAAYNLVRMSKLLAKPPCTAGRPVNPLARPTAAPSRNSTRERAAPRVHTA